MSVYYKMKNCKDYDSITFDGINISVGDLKRAIMEQKKLGKGDCDYLITDANNPETGMYQYYWHLFLLTSYDFNVILTTFK